MKCGWLAQVKETVAIGAVALAIGAAVEAVLEALVLA